MVLSFIALVFVYFLSPPMVFFGSLFGIEYDNTKFLSYLAISVFFLFVVTVFLIAAWSAYRVGQYRVAYHRSILPKYFAVCFIALGIFCLIVLGIFVFVKNLAG